MPQRRVGKNSRRVARQRVQRVVPPPPPVAPPPPPPADAAPPAAEAPAPVPRKRTLFERMAAAVAQMWPSDAATARAAIEAGWGGEQ